jgi:hypothetical protein
MSAQPIERTSIERNSATHPSRPPVNATAPTFAVPVAEDLRDLSGAVARLDRADLASLSADWFIYSCPWCHLDVVDANTLAVQIMERHLDKHVASGDHERPLLRVVS